MAARDSRRISADGRAKAAAPRGRLTARHWADAARAGELAKQLGSYRAEVHGITLFFASNTAKPRHAAPAAAAAARPAQRRAEQEEESAPPVPRGTGNARKKRAAERSRKRHLSLRLRLQGILQKALRAARWRRMQGVWTAWMSAETSLVVAAGGQSSLPADAAGKRRWPQGQEEPGCPGLPPVPAAAVAASHSPGASSTALTLLEMRAPKRSADKRSPNTGQKDGETAATSTEAGAQRALKPRRLAT